MYNNLKFYPTEANFVLIKVTDDNKPIQKAQTATVQLSLV
jgi:histidinol-phosphate/aromatic aminotransferase/cobyric acid decarboxylase-like protein